MNRCLTHNQEYDPASGWCVYCGKPGDGLQAAPVGPLTPSPMSSGSLRVCGSCGETLWAVPDATAVPHLCRNRVTVTYPGVSLIGTSLPFSDAKTFRTAVYGSKIADGSLTTGYLSNQLNAT